MQLLFCNFRLHIQILSKYSTELFQNLTSSCSKIFQLIFFLVTDEMASEVEAEDEVTFDILCEEDVHPFPEFSRIIEVSIYMATIPKS